MKTWFLNKIKGLKDQKTQLIVKAQSSEDLTEVKSINSQLESINTEIEDLEKQLATLDGQPGSSKGFNPMGTYVFGKGIEKTDSKKKSNEPTEEELEKQGDFLKGYNPDPTMKSIVLDQTIIVPHHHSDEVKQLPWNEVSSILDLVKPVPFENGESYDVPFEYEVGMAGETDEVKPDGTGGEYTSVETKFDKSSIGKAFITAYTEISKQFLKAPSARYAERVKANIYTSIRKKLARDIIIGTGGKNSIQGIFTQPETIANDDGKTTRPNRVIGKDIEISKIDADTLDTIIYNYGGETDVEAPLALLMNKMTLNDFAKVRDTNGNKIYDIKTAGNAFTIDGVRGIFTSHLKPFSKCATGDYFIGYGDPAAYELALYSAIDLQESKEFKFRQGMTCYSGDVFAGGNITAYQAWTRVKKQ